MQSDSLVRGRTAHAEEWAGALARKAILGRREHPITIGRSSANTIQIGARLTSISRTHAVITHQGESDTFSVRVAGMNGIKVNGTLHPRGSVVELQTGDQLNFVGIKYSFHLPDWQPEPAPRSKQARSLESELYDNSTDALEPEPAPRSKRARRDAPRARSLESELYDNSTDALEPEPAPRSKQARSLESELYDNSTDTLVGDLHSDLGMPAEAVPVAMRMPADDLPPSSPPHVSGLCDMYLEGVDGLLDVGAATPTSHCSRSPPPAHGRPVSAAVDAGDATDVEDDKENAVAKRHAEGPSAKPASSPSASALPPGHKPKPGKATRAPAKTPRRKRPRDDEMMKSLRELLGVVDPSECLASSVDSETEEYLAVPPPEPVVLAHAKSLVDLLVSSMVFSARTSHTISDILRDIATSEHDADARPDLWRHHVTWTLFHTKFFGRVERRVKDASDRRAEDKWYYDVKRDECKERRENFGGLVRTARRCTLRDTQYFFKQVPKLPAFRYK